MSSAEQQQHYSVAVLLIEDEEVIYLEALIWLWVCLVARTTGWMSSKIHLVRDLRYHEGPLHLHLQNSAVVALQKTYSVGFVLSFFC